METAKSCGFAEIVDTMEKLVSLEDLDVVDICTPNFLHCQQTLLAAQAGKHIYCEKPLANNSEQTKLMVEEVQKSNVVNQVAFVTRCYWSPLCFSWGTATLKLPHARKSNDMEITKE